MHQGPEIRGRTQDAVGTDADAKLAGGAMLIKVSETPGAGRNDRGLAYGGFLLLDDGQPAVDLFLLCI